MYDVIICQTPHSPTYFQISDKRYFGEYFAAKNILVLFRRVNTEKISENVNTMHKHVLHFILGITKFVSKLLQIIN